MTDKYTKRTSRLLKKCHCCNNTVNARLDDFSEIGWSGFQIGRGKVYCFCPICDDHTTSAAQTKLLKERI